MLLTEQAWGPEIDPQHPCTKTGRVRICNPALRDWGWAETSGFGSSLASQSSCSNELRDQ